MKLGFGKHKGSEIAELAVSESRYLIWLYTCDWVNVDTKVAIEEQFDNIKLEFGRHKGESVANVRDNDAKYFAWLTKPFVDSSSDNKQVTC